MVPITVKINYLAKKLQIEWKTEHPTTWIWIAVDKFCTWKPYLVISLHLNLEMQRATWCIMLSITAKIESNRIK